MAKFKTAIVSFEDKRYNYETSINPNCSDSDIINYFKGNLFNMGMVEDNMQKCIDCKVLPAKNI